MIVSLTVNQDKEAEFTRFYQHEFLPAVLEVVPEFTSVRRYEVVGELKWNRRRTLSIYEIESEDKAEAAFLGFARPKLSDMVAQFAQWKENDFSNFTRILYKPVYKHSRKPVDGAFGARPLFLTAHEIKPELAAGFRIWMHNTYLPRMMADVPLLMACRQYVSIGTDPLRHLTMFECPDEQSVNRAISDMGAPHRYQENEGLNNWENLAVEFRETCAYRQTYRYPD